MRSSERTIKRLGEIIAGDEAVSEDPGRSGRGLARYSEGPA
jgi:hypothetical protein